MQVSAVRNPEGFWINSSVFQEEANHFRKHGYYCPDPWGSPAWEDYWGTQLQRCEQGYTVGGVSITGHHYFYLNFSKIEKAVQISETVAHKVEDFPDFWDGDYNYYWSLEIARYGMSLERMQGLNLSLQPHPDFLDGGYNMIVGKARRKGYSYKNAAICANTYNTIQNSLTIIGAYDKKSLYPEGTMGMASQCLDFLNKSTGWAKGREFVNKVDHRRASFKETINGIDIESGYKSDIMALIFMDNPDAARGKDARIVLFEEAGKFPNLEEAYNATRPGLRAGKFATGQIIIFGTGGDMEKGTADFAKMYYNPKGYGLMPFKNIWDENAENTSCGFFHPFYWNYEGYYDTQGNSDKETALTDENKIRSEIIAEAGGNKILQGRVQEFPTCPAEAFLTVSFNDFPVMELRNRLNFIIREKIHHRRGQPCFIFRDKDGKAKLRPDLQHELEPLWNYEVKSKNRNGAVVVFEAPMPDCEKLMYKIGFDPYRQVRGESLACIYVYKSNQKLSATRDSVVAVYIGRPSDPDDVNKIAVLLAELYNTEVMHENEVTHVKNYFERHHKLHLLAAQPDRVISANINDSKVARIYGCHMVDKLKDAGEKYIKSWLLRERDFVDGKKLINIDTLDDPGLIEELLIYNRKGNFDRVMAFMMVMFQCEEEDLGREFNTDKKTDKAAEMAEYLERMYRRAA